MNDEPNQPVSSEASPEKGAPKRRRRKARVPRVSGDPRSLRASNLLGLALRATKRSLLPWNEGIGVAVVGLLLPQVIFSLLMGGRAFQVGETIRTMSQNPAMTFVDLLNQLTPFLTTSVLGIFMLWLAMFTSYLYFVQRAHLYFAARRGLPGSGALWSCLRIALTKGLVVSLLFAFLLAISQVFVATALILIVMAMMAPVLLVVERHGGFRTFTRTLTVQYARRGPYNSWSVFFSLVTICGLFFLAQYVFMFFFDQILEFDRNMGISRSLWSRPLPGLPYSPVFAVVDLLDSIVGSALLLILAGASTALYHTAAGRLDPISTSA